MGLPLKELLGGDLPPISRTTVAIATAGFIGAVLVRQFFRILRRLAGERWQAWALKVGESREMLRAMSGKLDELRRSSDERVLNAFLVGASRATPEDSEDSKAAQRALAQFY